MYLVFHDIIIELVEGKRGLRQSRAGCVAGTRGGGGGGARGRREEGGGSWAWLEGRKGGGEWAEGRQGPGGGRRISVG